VELKKIVKSHLTGRSLLGRELEYIFQTMSIGQIAGDQTYSPKCHALLVRWWAEPHYLVSHGFMPAGAVVYIRQKMMSSGRCALSLSLSPTIVHANLLACDKGEPSEQDES